MQEAGTRLQRRERWLVPPRLRTTTDEDGERHATWLELFFDLVFVVAITQLAHELVLDHSAGGFLRFAGLFVPVFVAWQGYSFYADRFDSDDLLLRAVFFAAMLAIAALAVLIPDVARGVHSSGFVIAYVVLRSLMLCLYLRAWFAVPAARPLISLYGGGYAVGAAIWLASLLVAPPARYVVWGVALTLELSLPPLSTHIHRRVPTSGSHVPERWALFTLIALGESVTAVALETSGTHWRVVSAAAAAIGFVSVAALWWLYFDRQASVVLTGTARSVVIYSYVHLPLIMGLAAMSAGLRLLIDHASASHLGAGATVALVGGIVLFLLSLVATRTVTVTGRRKPGAALKLGAAAVLVAVALGQGVLAPAALASAVALVLVAVIAVERTFLRHA
jgi:low temperature requirement protein LtrA